MTNINKGKIYHIQRGKVCVVANIVCSPSSEFCSFVFYWSERQIYIFENKVGLTANGIFLYVEQPTLLKYRTIICIFDEALNLFSQHLLECQRPHDKLNFERSLVFTHFEKIFPVLLFFLLILYRFYGFSMQILSKHQGI